MSDKNYRIYHQLLCHSWLSDGLPKDEVILKRIVGRKVPKEVMDKFSDDGGTLKQVFLEDVRVKQRLRIDRSRKKVAAMNAAKEEKRLLVEARKAALVEPLQDRLVGPPHHSPLTTHPVLLVKEPKPISDPNGSDGGDFAAACEVKLDTGEAQLTEAWEEWQKYRQSRHGMKGKDRQRWTLQAARLSASQVKSHVATHGTQIVADRITSAIAGNWQGLNLDKIEIGRKSRPEAPPGNDYSWPSPDDWNKRNP